MKRALIEQDLPIKEISSEAQRERSVRPGHIATLHVWWARRPLVLSRAAVFAGLLESPPAQSAQARSFLAQLCKWSVHDGNLMGHSILQEARASLRDGRTANPPKVLDPFAGGGSIPLEALRLGCEAHAVEYNPVAYIVLKATLEYPQKYGARLAADVKRIGKWVFERAYAELARFYPPGPDGDPVVGYIWCKTVRCPNSSCRAEIPLFRQFWLARRPKRRIALRPVLNRAENRVDFEVLEGKQLEAAVKAGFNPSRGIVMRASAQCPLCGAAASGAYIRGESTEGRMGERLVALVTSSSKAKGRRYHIARPEDLEAFRQAAERLEEVTQEPSPWAGGLPWLPEEPMDQSNPNLISGRGYGVKQWKELFNARQALALVTFGKWVRRAISLVGERAPDYAKSLGTYLALGLDFTANRGSTLAGWEPQASKLRSSFATHALKMNWDYAESNPLSQHTGGWRTALDYQESFLKREGALGGLADPECAKALATYLAFALDKLADRGAALCHWEPSRELIGHVFTRHGLNLRWDYFESSPLSPVTQQWGGALAWLSEFASRGCGRAAAVPVLGSAASLPYADATFDLIVTDPPYGDNVPYAELSDFFYVWLKRAVGDLYPEAFQQELVPKAEEATASPFVHGGGKLGKEAAWRHYERMMGAAVKEMARVLKPGAAAIIMFAHRAAAAWRVLASSIEAAGLRPTACWPIVSEREASSHIAQTASLRTCALLVCRKPPPEAPAPPP